MIKSVVLAILTYDMSCFKLPLSLFTELENLIASFWWGQKEQEQKIHWLSWDNMCHSKFHGGLGFEKLNELNL